MLTVVTQACRPCLSCAPLTWQPSPSVLLTHTQPHPTRQQALLLQPLPRPFTVLCHPQAPVLLYLLNDYVVFHTYLLFGQDGGLSSSLLPLSDHCPLIHSQSSALVQIKAPLLV